MSTPTSAIDVLPGDRHDRRLIKLLLAHLSRQRGQLWTSLDFPEERIRSRDAVQVIAMEQSGRVTAIEHVRLEGFAGETAGGQRLLPVFEALARDPALHVPGFDIEIAVPVEAVPNEVDARLLASGVRGWCERHVKSMPAGRSANVIMVSRAPLKIQVEKTACPGEIGRVSVTQSRPPGDFEAVVHDCLEAKLPRLAAASADRRVMLFEKHDGLWSLAQLRLELEGARLEFPDLNTLSEVWLADTVAHKLESAVAFRLVLRNDDE